MNEIPSLPERVSNDGREIWDWAGKLSEWSQRQDQKRDLRRKVAEIQTKCGSCEYWMTRMCPRERPNNMTGRSEGPSMASPICNKFSMQPWSAKLLEQWKAELSQLDVAAQPSPGGETGR